MHSTAFEILHFLLFSDMCILVRLCFFFFIVFCCFFFQAEDGIRDFCLSRGLGDVYKRQAFECAHTLKGMLANMGLIPLYDIVVRIVEPLRAGEPAELLPVCDELLAARDRLNTLLKESA